MGLFKYLVWFVRSLFPAGIEWLENRSLGELIAFIIGLHFLALLISLVLYIPVLGADVSADVRKIESFNVQVNYSAKGPVELLSRPGVVVDMDDSQKGDAWISVSNESFTYRRFLFFGSQTVNYRSSDDLRDNTNVILYFVIFFLPAILFWVFVFFLVKNVILALLIALIGWLLFVHRRLTFVDSITAACIALAPLAFIDVLLWPFVVSYIPSLLYIVYFGFVASLLSEPLT